MSSSANTQVEDTKEGACECLNANRSSSPEPHFQLFWLKFLSGKHWILLEVLRRVGRFVLVRAKED